MAGQIQGAYFKAIIGSMTAASHRFPQQQQFVNSMRDEAWYDWEDYVRMTSELQTALGDKGMEALAQKSVMRSLPLFRARGIDSVEKVFGGYDALSRDAVRDLPAGESMRTVAFTTTSAELETESRLPSALLLGTFRGFLMGLGKLVTETKVTTRGTTRRFSLKWV
ncbi:hypothetical protein JGU66_21850 [Myxococcaceae bacterium JPH2]|nr:hypothetical protein [Myxococcaceae bacterium JPH2]